MTNKVSTMTRVRHLVFLGLCIFACSPVFAGWHSGKLDNIGFAYEGSQVTFRLIGVSLSCACPTYWQQYICLNPNRQTYKEEYALLLSAKARDAELHVNVDESTCQIIAIYEPAQN